MESTNFRHEEEKKGCSDASLADGSFRRGQCYLMTKNGKLKEYSIEIEVAAVILTCPQTSKQKCVAYPLDSLHCIVKSTRRANPSILLVCPGGRKREIFFETQELAKYWHESILCA